MFPVSECVCVFKTGNDYNDKDFLCVSQNKRLRLTAFNVPPKWVQVRVPKYFGRQTKNL